MSKTDAAYMRDYRARKKLERMQELVAEARVDRHSEP